MESAADQRLQEAVALALEFPRHAITSAYLMGYTVECTLKAAFGRILGLAVSDDLYQALLSSTLQRNRLHDLNALLGLCNLARSQPLKLNDSDAFTKHVQITKNNSDVIFRYKTVPVTLEDLTDLYNSVDWIMRNRSLLWS